MKYDKAKTIGNYEDLVVFSTLFYVCIENNY